MNGGDVPSETLILTDLHRLVFKRSGLLVHCGGTAEALQMLRAAAAGKSNQTVS